MSCSTSLQSTSKLPLRICCSSRVTLTSTCNVPPHCASSPYVFYFLYSSLILILIFEKVGDIAAAVAQQFVPTFQSGLVTIANTALNNNVNTYPTTIQLPEYGLSFNMQGGFEFLPAQPNANLVLFGEGKYT